MSWTDLRELASFRAQRGLALSLYFDLGPVVAPTPGEVQRRSSALLDEAAKLLRSTEDRLSHEANIALRSEVDRVRQFQEGLDRDGSHGLAIFSAPLDGLWRVLPLGSRVADAVRVGSDLHLTPLVDHVDADRVIVAYAGRERGDVYVLRNGGLTKVSDRGSEQPRRHDQGGWSQANFQRHVDELARAHLREVVDALERQLRRSRATAVVLAGTDDTRAELEPLLPDSVRSAVVGWTHVEAHASSSDLELAAQAVLGEHRAQRERLLLERWREDAGRGSRAVGGWKETSEAASDGRVETLLFQDDAGGTLWRCPKCGRAQADDEPCALDGSSPERHPEGLDLLLHKVLEHGGTAEVVSDRRDLAPVGGIGALLRF